MELCEDTYSVFDSLIYPQVSKGFYSFNNADFIEPDQRNEGELCFELYFRDYFSPMQLLSDDVKIFSSKLLKVYDSLMSSRKVNIKRSRSSFMILNVTGETIDKVSEQGYSHHGHHNACRCFLKDHVSFWLTCN